MVLNDRFGTNFTEEDRLFFEQIREKAVNDEKVIRTARANPLDKFQLGIRKLIEDLMIQRMADNDKIVTRYMDDQEFQNSAFPILAKEILNPLRLRMMFEDVGNAEDGQRSRPARHHGVLPSREAARTKRRVAAYYKMVGAEGFEPPTYSSQSYRATRLRYAPLVGDK